jgi:hypothetical protein
MKHVHEFIGPLFPPYDHVFTESAFNMEFMLHIQATIFYHRDIIGTKSTIRVCRERGGGSGRGMGISKRYRPSGDIRVCGIRCTAVGRSKWNICSARKLHFKIGRKEMKNKLTQVNLQSCCLMSTCRDGKDRK